MGQLLGVDLAEHLEVFFGVGLGLGAEVGEQTALQEDQTCDVDVGFEHVELGGGGFEDLWGVEATLGDEQGVCGCGRWIKYLDQ